MITTIIEATNGPRNWGKFLVGRFDAVEMSTKSAVDEGRLLLRAIGHDPMHEVIVIDLQTNEGGIFKLGGLASADLHKHQVWVCPLFEPFLTWLYTQDLTDVTKLPAHVDLLDAPFEVAGYRRKGHG